MLALRTASASPAETAQGGPSQTAAGHRPPRTRRRQRHVIEPRRPGLRATIHELRTYKWCIPYFGKVYLLKRYQRTWLGFLWVPLKPGFNMASKILVFGGVIGISTGNVPYTVFFLIATASWQLFVETSLWATRSLEIGRAVLRQIELPRLPLILASVVPGSVEFCVYMIFAAIALAYYAIHAHIFYLHLGVWTLLVPAGVALLIMLGLGVGLITASAGARGRDIRYALQFSFGFLYFVTPVLYPLSKIPPKWRPLAELNPVTGAMEMVKDGLFHSHELTFSASAVAIAGAVALWIVGLWLHHRSIVQRAVLA